jgi:hypothetical protein
MLRLSTKPGEGFYQIEGVGSMILKPKNDENIYLETILKSGENNRGPAEGKALPGNDSSFQPLILRFQIRMTPPLVIFGGLLMGAMTYFLARVFSPPLTRITSRLANLSSIGPKALKG